MRLFCIYIKRSFIQKYYLKLIWVLNNFLTMECYRKLCNKLYWKKLKPGTMSYTTRCWLIFVTALSMIWLAFFFDPLDPDYSKSSSRFFFLISNIYRKLETTLDFLSQGVKNTPQNFYFKTHRFPDIDNIFLWCSQNTYLRTSAILI